MSNGMGDIATIGRSFCGKENIPLQKCPMQNLSAHKCTTQSIPSLTISYKYQALKDQDFSQKRKYNFAEYFQ